MLHFGNMQTYVTRRAAKAARGSENIRRARYNRQKRNMQKNRQTRTGSGRVTLTDKLKIGVSLASLRMPLRRAISTASRLGASAVEIEARGELRPSEMTETGLRQLRKLLDDASLKVCSVSLPTRRGYNVLEGLDQRISATKAAMRMAYQLRAPVLVNRIGRVKDDPESADWKLFVEALHDLAQHGDRVGATFAARTGSEEGEVLARLLKEVPAGGIGIDFDPAALIINNFSATEALQALGPHVRQFRARDGVRDFSQGRGVETPLGRGTADFPTLFGLLEDFSFRGYYTIDREDSQDPLTDISNAISFLQSVMTG